MPPKTLDDLYGLNDPHPDQIRANTFIASLDTLKINGDVCAGKRLVESLFLGRIQKRDWPMIEWYAVALTNEGRAAAALELYQQRLAVIEGGALEWVRFAFILQKSGADPAEVQKAYTKAVALEPEVATLYGYLGYHMIETGKTSDAIEVLNVGFSINPEDLTVLEALAEAYGAAGDSAAQYKIAKRIKEWSQRHPEYEAIPEFDE